MTRATGFCRTHFRRRVASRLKSPAHQQRRRDGSDTHTKPQEGDLKVVIFWSLARRGEKTARWEGRRDRLHRPFSLPNGTQTALEELSSPAPRSNWPWPHQTPLCSLFPPGEGAHDVWHEGHGQGRGGLAISMSRLASAGVSMSFHMREHRVSSASHGPRLGAKALASDVLRASVCSVVKWAQLQKSIMTHQHWCG